MSVYRLAHNMLHENEELINRYFYQDNNAGSAPALAALFATEVVPLVKAVQSTSVTHVSLEVTNLVDLSDWTILSLSGTGDNSGSYMPDFTAFGYILNRTTRQTRSGSKRIGVPVESWIDDGVAVPSVMTQLNQLAAGMAATLDVLGAEYKPVIFRFGVDGSPNPLAGAIANPVASVQYVRVTTQNSRKR